VNSGIYTAYSGMQARLDALDILANNLANASTTGFKGEKAFYTLLHKSLDDSRGPENLNSVITQSIQTRASLDGEAGSLVPTNRDLDIAIEGNGFLVVDTPGGIRYTRNGSLHQNAQSVLATADGYPVLGADGRAIALGSGKVTIRQDGAVLLDGAEAGRLKVVAFENLSGLQKEGNSLFINSAKGAGESISNATIRSGYLEQSNVNAVGSIVQMVDILRSFESIQKSVSQLNDINSKAIEKLGR
jgi:flagellar basal-body rod protein FlgF